MITKSEDRRALAVVASLAITMVASLGTPTVGLGQAPATAKARPADLLKSAPFDRITLIDNSVHDVEPLSPRPLPPIDPKKRSRSLVNLDEAARKAEENRPRRGDPFIRKDVDESEQFVIIHMLEGEPRDFKVKRASIKNVDYFEDMLLAEGDRFLKDGDYTRAFERYLLVRFRDPNWKGLAERVNRLLFEEGSAALAEDNARGLRLLTDLAARKPDYPGLADQMASSYARRISGAFEAGDFLVGRRLLRELEQVAPNHGEARSARARFVNRAKGLIDQAMKANASDRVNRLAEAARIWPESEGLESAYLEAFQNEPTLTVAVADIAGHVGPFPDSPGSERIARLLYLPILASDDESATRGEAPGQLLAGLELTELGKGIKISLRSGPIWSDGSRVVSAIDVARSLADRALPASPGYNARWADLLDRVEPVERDPSRDQAHPVEHEARILVARPRRPRPRGGRRLGLVAWVGPAAGRRRTLSMGVLGRLGRPTPLGCKRVKWAENQANSRDPLSQCGLVGRGAASRRHRPSGARSS